MLIFCFSNHSFLQKWLFFFPCCRHLYLPLTVKGCHNSSCFPFLPGKNQTQRTCSWLGSEELQAPVFLQAGRAGHPLAMLCCDAGPMERVRPDSRRASEKTCAWQGARQPPNTLWYAGCSAVFLASSLPPCPINETPSQMAGWKDPFFCLPSHQAWCPWNCCTASPHRAALLLPLMKAPGWR